MLRQVLKYLHRFCGFDFLLSVYSQEKWHGFSITVVHSCSTFNTVDGIDFPHAPDPVRIMFILLGSKDERNYHLRALMAIAQIAQEEDFDQRWLATQLHL